MVKSNIQSTFWVSNISNRNVSLSDLRLTIPAYKTVNLADSRHYNFTNEQLTASAISGSIYKKRNKIIIRQVPPIIEEKQLTVIDYNAVVPTRRRSSVKIEEVYYEELDISDEKFAAEAADLADQNFNKG